MWRAAIHTAETRTFGREWAIWHEWPDATEPDPPELLRTNT